MSVADRGVMEGYNKALSFAVGGVMEGYKALSVAVRGVMEG